MEYIVDDTKTDMAEAMRNEAKEVIEEAMTTEDYQTHEKDVCAHIRKRFDEKYYPQWHCVMGKKFGT